MDSDVASPISSGTPTLNGNFKPPKSKISELLPSNILDEIECAHKTEAQSSKNLLTSGTFSIQENVETKSTNSSNKQLNNVIGVDSVIGNTIYNFKPPRRNIKSSINVVGTGYNMNVGMNQFGIGNGNYNVFHYTNSGNEMNVGMGNVYNGVNNRTTFNKPRRSLNSDNFIVGNVLKNNMFINSVGTLDNSNSSHNNNNQFFRFNGLKRPSQYVTEMNTQQQQQQPFQNMFLYNHQPHLNQMYTNNNNNNTCNNIYQSNYIQQFNNTSLLNPSQTTTRPIQSKAPPLTEAQIESILSQLQSQYESSLPSSLTDVPQQPQIIPLAKLLESIGSNLFLKIIRTNKGSRYLQKSLSFSPPTQTDIDVLLHCLTQNIEIIMCDYYGNYFLQKFLPYLSLRHRLILYHHIQPNFLLIAHDICGNHTLQGLILLQNSKEEEQIIKECLENNLETLCFGPNSSHVVQKVLKCVKEVDREYINTYIISNLIDLCLNPNGICVVKEFIDTMESEFYMRAIVSMFEIETHRLTFDQFGNFGIQEVIKVFGDVHCKRIIHKITEHLLEFSLSKFSSNVVDFVVDYLSKNNKKKFMDVLSKIFFEDDNLKEMLKSKFATYVIENCLVILDALSENDKQISEIKTNIVRLLNSIPTIKDKKKISKLVQALIEKEYLTNQQQQ